MRPLGLRLALRGGRAPPGVEEVSDSDTRETWASDRILAFDREKGDSWDPLYEARFLIGDLLDAAEPLWNLSLCPAANSSSETPWWAAPAANDSTAPSNGTECPAAPPCIPLMRSDWRGERIPMAPGFNMVSRADSVRKYNAWY